MSSTGGIGSHFSPAGQSGARGSASVPSLCHWTSRALRLPPSSLRDHHRLPPPPLSPPTTTRFPPRTPHCSTAARLLLLCRRCRPSVRRWLRSAPLHPEPHLAVFPRGEARARRSWKVSLYLSPSLPSLSALSSSSSSSPAANPNREVLTTFLLPQSASRYLAALPCESHKGRSSAAVPHCVYARGTHREEEGE